MAAEMVTDTRPMDSKQACLAQIIEGFKEKGYGKAPGGIQEFHALITDDEKGEEQIGYCLQSRIFVLTKPGRKKVAFICEREERARIGDPLRCLSTRVEIVTPRFVEKFLTNHDSYAEFGNPEALGNR